MKVVVRVEAKSIRGDGKIKTSLGVSALECRKDTAKGTDNQGMGQRSQVTAFPDGSPVGEEPNSKIGRSPPYFEGTNFSAAEFMQ